MDEARLDALFLTTPANWRYLTGFSSQTWAVITRHRFLIIPAKGDPIIVCPRTNLIAVRETTWVNDVRIWEAPNPADDGVSLMVDALRSLAGRHGRIGAELGPESRLGFPVGDFMRIAREIAPLEIVDGDHLLRRVRMVKSPAEVARVRHIATTASLAYEALPPRLQVGDSEREVVAKLKGDLVARGVEQSPYLICVSGPGGYTNINSGPSDRVTKPGDILIMDTGSSYDGYFCDFDREYAFGPPSDPYRRSYDLVWEATERALAAAKAGVRMSELWHVMAEALGGAEKARSSNVGRMGHGLGMQITEPPSLHPNDHTVLVPGMVITIEPGLGFLNPEGEKRVLVHEENVVITETGCELLTRRAPPSVWVVA